MYVDYTILYNIVVDIKLCMVYDHKMLMILAQMSFVQDGNFKYLSLAVLILFCLISD